MWEGNVQLKVADMRHQRNITTEGGPGILTIYGSIAEAAAVTQLPLQSPSQSSQHPFGPLLTILEELLSDAGLLLSSDLLAGLPASWHQTADAATSVFIDSVNGSHFHETLGSFQPWNSGPHRIGSYQNLLQSTLLLLKLATLISSMGVQTSNTQAAVGVLWNTLRGLTNSMAAYASSKSKSGISSTSSMSALAAVSEQNEENRIITKLVAQLAVQEYCKAVTCKPAIADTCCKMMIALLQASVEGVCRVAASQVSSRGYESFAVSGMLQSSGTFRAGIQHQCSVCAKAHSACQVLNLMWPVKALHVSVLAYHRLYIANCSGLGGTADGHANVQGKSEDSL